MDFSESWHLKELPDLSNVENLERLITSNCWRLEELPPSIANLQKLEWLEMDYCINLEDVPNNLNLASLHRVFMTGCRRMSYIPDIARNMTELTISDAMLEQVPDSVRFCHLKILRIKGNIAEVKGADIEEIPDWIKDLHQLEVLYINHCPKLASLPELPASLINLTVDNCESLETLVNPFPVFLNFPNCFSMDQESRRFITQEPVRACLPGRTIPEEFNQRASGNSLTIRSDFHQFKVCVVVSPNQLIDESGVDLVCDIHINGCSIEKHKIYQSLYLFQTEHLYMSSVLFSDEDEAWLEQDNEILFEFSTTSNKFDIIECGVQTLTDETSSSDESSSEELSSEYEDESPSDDCSNEFDEPRVKRLKT